MDNHEEIVIGEGNLKYNWLPDFVYGGIDGAVTTFAVVAGVEGASLSVGIILVLGFANLLADGFSMAAGKYSSDKANQEQYESIRQVEFRHIEERREHEIQEVRDILALYGFKGEDKERATQVIISNPEAWVDLMMRNEFNMTMENVHPVKGGAATFASFLMIGSIPLLAYVFKPILDLSDSSTFTITVVATLLALFVVGMVKSRFSVKKWYWSGLETVFIGGLAAGIAYLVGFLLKGLVG